MFFSTSLGSRTWQREKKLETNGCFHTDVNCDMFIEGHELQFVLGGGNSNIFGIFTRIPGGNSIQFDLRIFFKWVGSTTNV